MVSNKTLFAGNWQGRDEPDFCLRAYWRLPYDRQCVIRSHAHVVTAGSDDDIWHVAGSINRFEECDCPKCNGHFVEVQIDIIVIAPDEEVARVAALEAYHFDPDHDDQWNDPGPTVTRVPDPFEGEPEGSSIAHAVMPFIS